MAWANVGSTLVLFRFLEVSRQNADISLKHKEKPTESPGRCDAVIHRQSVA